jgi:hypothetical protein
MFSPEAQYLEDLEDIESDCRRVPALLIDLAQRRGVTANSAKLRSMLSNVASIAERCREERERFGLWRDDGLEPGDIIDEIDRQLTQFVSDLESELPNPASRRENSE